MGKKKRPGIKGRLTASEQRSLELRVRELTGKNYTPTQIMEDMNMQPHVLSQYLQRINDIDKENFESLNNVKVYSDYISKSHQMIKELDKLKTKFQNRGQWTALVSAIKEKRAIYNDCLKVGQNFGFIEKQKTEVHIETEMTFSTMTKEEVEAELRKSVIEMNQMVNDNVIEMRPELLDSLDENKNDIKKYIPNYTTSKVELGNKKIKKKIKITLRK